MANSSGNLESELQLLSRSLLGEELKQVHHFQEVAEFLAAGGGPVTITLKWWDKDGSRQSLVIHEIQQDQVLLFDPTRELAEHLQAEGRELQVTSSEGIFLVSREFVEGWFVEREALGLLPSSPPTGGS